jgi:cell division inhibitor SepF
MGFFDKLRDMTRPYDDDDDFLDESAPDETPADSAPRTAAPAPEKRSPFSSSYGESTTTTYESPRQSRAAARESKVVSLNNSSQLKVVLVKPERFDEAAEIADHLRDKRTVVMNLEDTDKEISRRLIDFLAGVAYALDGKIKKVAAGTYIITPYNVDLMGSLLDDMETGGIYY